MHDATLCIINDGNGDQCGVTYEQRCTGRRDLFVRAARRYSWWSHKRFDTPELTNNEVALVANELQDYYEEHRNDLAN